MAFIRHQPGRGGLRARLHEIIFEADTPAGKLFDVALIAAILLSVAVVLCDSVAALRDRFGALFTALEWTLTLLFTLEYALRLYSVRRPMLYARSFFGVVDLCSILPTWIGLVLPGGEYLLVIRLVRVLRVFRVFKLAQYLDEANLLLAALRASARKIAVFLVAVLTLVVMFGSCMYLIEGAAGWFHLHSPVHLLGHCHPDHGGLWRHLAANAPGPSRGLGHHDPRVRHHRRAHGHRHLGHDAGGRCRGVHPGLPSVRGRRP